MSQNLTVALEVAKRAARDQWQRDLQSARERYDRAIRLAEDTYERERERAA